MKRTKMTLYEIAVIAQVIYAAGCGTKGKPLTKYEADEPITVSDNRNPERPQPRPTESPSIIVAPKPLPVDFISFDTTPLFLEPFELPAPQPLPMVKPSWCGLTTVADSDGINEVYSVSCRGKSPKSECPTGYTQLSVGLLPNPLASKSATLYTCIPNADTMVPITDDDSSWCGVGLSNKGSYSSFSIKDGSTTGSGVSCLGHDVLNSCPQGYNRYLFKTTANGSDDVADTLGVCIRKRNGGGAITNAGGWFGFAGTPGQPAASNGSFNIPFGGKNIIDECPGTSKNMAQFTLSSSAFNPTVQRASSKSLACIFTP